MLNKIDVVDMIDWKKVQGMVPVIIQHYLSGEVLMHGYMNRESLKKTQNEKLVTFYSRTKKRLWTKGEISNNYLKLINLYLDCDNDTLLIFANPKGHTCHLNQVSCFKNTKLNLTFFYQLESLLKYKKNDRNNCSYTFSLHKSGVNRIAQKVAEEAIEVAIAAVSNNKFDFVNEVSDLLYHLLVLLHSYNLDFDAIITNLRLRYKQKYMSNND